MKTGRSLQEVMLELDRQNKAKKDYIGSAQALRLYEDGKTLKSDPWKKRVSLRTTRLFPPTGGVCPWHPGQVL